MLNALTRLGLLLGMLIALLVSVHGFANMFCEQLYHVDDYESGK